MRLPTAWTQQNRFSLSLSSRWFLQTELKVDLDFERRSKVRNWREGKQRRRDNHTVNRWVLLLACPRLTGSLWFELHQTLLDQKQEDGRTLTLIHESLLSTELSGWLPPTARPQTDATDYDKAGRRWSSESEQLLPLGVGIWGLYSLPSVISLGGLAPEIGIVFVFVVKFKFHFRIEPINSILRVGGRVMTPKSLPSMLTTRRCNASLFVFAPANI